MMRGILAAAALAALSAAAVAADMVNINTASVEELATLENVGEARAHSIVEYRDRQGEFPSVSSLVNVSGIGEATLARNRDRLTVGAE